MSARHSSTAISPLVRAALRVGNLDRAHEFYRALGLTEIHFDGALDCNAAPALLGVQREARIRCRILKTPGQPNFGMVGLFQIDEATSRQPEQTRGPSFRIGEVALVFFVTDLEVSLTAALLAGGARISGPLTLVTADGAQPEALLRDPDGVLINLIERAPVEAFAFIAGR